MPGSLHQPELTTSTTNTALLLQTYPIAQLGGVSFEWWTTLVHATMIDPTMLHNQRSPMCLKRGGCWDAIPVTQSLPLHFMDSRKRCLYLKSEWNDQLSWMKWWFFTVPLNNSNILCKNDRPGCTTLQACLQLLYLATGISNLSKTINKILRYSSHWLELGAPMTKKSSK